MAGRLGGKGYPPVARAGEEARGRIMCRGVPGEGGIGRHAEGRLRPGEPSRRNTVPLEDRQRYVRP
jgi:hypothetical protein